MDKPLTICLPSGRTLKECIQVLSKAGLPVKNLKDHGRKLFIKDDRINYIIAKPYDVVVYLYKGIADLGMAGSDIITERALPVVEFLDLKIGMCRMVLATTQEKEHIFKNGNLSKMLNLRIATKYPNFAKKYLQKKNIDAEVIHLQGSIELAPITGLADLIIDIVQTGTTLAENKLTIIDEIDTISTRLIGSHVRARLKDHLVIEIVERLTKVTE